MRYRIDIKPPESIAQQLNDYAREIAPSTWKLLMGAPHCTIMGLHAKQSDEGNVINAVREVVGRNKPFTLTTGALDMFADSTGRNQSILVLRLSSPAFTAIHKEIIEALHPYIDWGNAYALEGLDQKQDAVWRKYGSPFYGEEFNPHVSIAKLNRPVDLDDRFAGQEWGVAVIGISRRDEEGWKTIIEFPLG